MKMSILPGKRKYGSALNNSFGFGGHKATVVATAFTG